MQNIADYASKIQFIKQISERTQIAPQYIASAIAIVFLIFIWKTSLGAFLSNGAILGVVGRELIFSMRAPNTKVSQFKRISTVFAIFGCFVLAENIGIDKIIPIFSILKMAVVFWAFSSEQNAATIYEATFAQIPIDFLRKADGINEAVRKVAEVGEMMDSESITRGNKFK